MALIFSEIELRLLGVMMEKSLSNPAGYPLTLNAAVLGANQKQNRDPVINHAESDIAKAMHGLQQKNLARQASPLPGARANRFEHTVIERFRWDRREQAIMAELILRGRQTVGELRTRAARMTPFPDLAAASTTLAALAAYDPPQVEELAREPGRSANRFRHLLGTNETPETSAAPATTEQAQRPPVSDEVDPHIDMPIAAPSLEPNSDRLEELEARVGRLERLVNRLNEAADS